MNIARLKEIEEEHTEMKEQCLGHHLDDDWSFWGKAKQYQQWNEMIWLDVYECFSGYIFILMILRDVAGTR